jgi:site-specific recombinase XerD
MSEARKYLTETELEAFFKASRKTRNGIRDYCMAIMAYRHGFRVSELIDLRMDEVHLDMARLDIRRLKKGLSGHHPIEGDELRAIRAWLKERTVHKFSGSPNLFLSERGPFTRQAVNYLFEVIGQKAGLMIKVHPHMLRHSCGYKLANDERTTRDIQDYLGHRDIRQTAKYTALNAERFRDFFRRK